MKTMTSIIICFYKSIAPYQIMNSSNLFYDLYDFEGEVDNNIEE